MIYRLLALAIAVASIFGAGMGYQAHRDSVKALQASIAASEQARKVEHENAVSLVRRMDSYSVTQAQNAARAAESRAVVASVQHSAAAIASAAPASACGVDPRLSVLAELLAEGAGLVEEGAREVERLRAQRDALK